jgi:hypothetical protein
LVPDQLPASSAEYSRVNDPGAALYLHWYWCFRRRNAGVSAASRRAPAGFTSGDDYHHTWAAFVSSYHYDIDTTLSLDLLAKLARHRALEGQGRTMTPKSFEVMPDSTIAPLAVRYRYQVEDRNVPYDKGKLHNLEGQGALLVHPDTPHLVIALEYSERAESSIAMMRSAAGDSFLAHLSLMRPTQRRTPSDVGYGPSRVRPGRSGWLLAASPGDKDGKV